MSDADPRCSGPDLDEPSLEIIDFQYAVGLVAYLVVVAVSFVSVAASVLGNVLLAIYFALPPHVHLVWRHRRVTKDRRAPHDLS